MDREYPSTLNQARVDRPMSRIDNETERVKEMTRRIHNNIDRLVRHAQSLGYFDMKSNAGAGSPAPTPVVSNLSDAISEHDRALDMLAGALNLFD